jgi:hypothetical protein
MLANIDQAYLIHRISQLNSVLSKFIPKHISPYDSNLFLCSRYFSAKIFGDFRVNLPYASVVFPARFLSSSC